VIVPCIIDSWDKVSRQKAGSKPSHWVVIVSWGPVGASS
jgi:hypothetical protein